jgi:hypothetical protein
MKEGTLARIWVLTKQRQTRKDFVLSPDRLLLGVRDWDARVSWRNEVQGC